MNKIRITHLDQDIPALVRLKIGQALKRSNIEEEITELIIGEIKDKGIKPELEKSSIKHRQYLERFNPTDKDYSATKSNLTLTGELLKSFKTKLAISSFTFSFFPSNKRHKKYKTGTNKSKSTAPTMSEIIGYQEGLGRDIKNVLKREDVVNRLKMKVISAIKRFYKN